MAKPFKSQWEFGELFPATSSSLGRKILSVAELTFQIRRVLEKEVGQVWVTGEITNLRVQSSGHVYFTLKDAAAQLSCVRQMLRLAESLVYDMDEETSQKAARLAEQYMADLKQLPEEKLASKKDEIKHLRDVANYLTRCNVIPQDYEGKTQLDQIIKDHNWDKKSTRGL